MINEQLTPPRKLVRLGRIIRKGLPTVGRYKRYIVTIAVCLCAIWVVPVAYLAVTPKSYESHFTLILPGTGVGSSLNMENMGQANISASSAFASSSLSPTESYKRLLTADVTLTRAAKAAGVPFEDFPAPVIELVDQTNLIEVKIRAADPKTARAQAEALRQSFLVGLDGLRLDESEKREAAERTNLAALQTKVDDAQSALLTFQSRTGLISMGQFNSRIGALESTKDRERLARVQARQDGAVAGTLASSMGVSPAYARRAMILSGDPVFQALLGDYAKTKVETTRMGASLGDRNGDYVVGNAENGALRSRLMARGTELTGLSGGQVLRFADLSLDPAMANVMGSMVERNAVAAGASAGLSETQRQLSQMRAEAPGLVHTASELARLERGLQVAETVFTSALARLDTNKADPFSSYPLVQTLEDPSLPKSHSSPSTMIAFVGAFLASILMILGFALLWLRQPILDKVLRKKSSLRP
jgi:uncharacterized protein involved in exopolysaccharide biosynthesis